MVLETSLWTHLDQKRLQNILSSEAILDHPRWLQWWWILTANLIWFDMARLVKLTSEFVWMSQGGMLVGTFWSLAPSFGPLLFFLCVCPAWAEQHSSAMMSSTLTLGPHNHGLKPLRLGGQGKIFSFKLFLSWHQTSWSQQRKGD